MFWFPTTIPRWSSRNKVCDQLDFKIVGVCDAIVVKLVADGEKNDEKFWGLDEEELRENEINEPPIGLTQPSRQRWQTCRVYRKCIPKFFPFRVRSFVFCHCWFAGFVQRDDVSVHAQFPLHVLDLIFSFLGKCHFGSAKSSTWARS